MNRIKFVRVIIVELAILSLFSYLFPYWRNIGQNIIFDDAFMFTRYAKHWLAGNGFSWNSIDGPSYGITSPLYLFIVTALRETTTYSDNLILNSLSFVAGLLSIVVLIILGFLCCEAKWVQELWIPLLIVPCLTFTNLFGFHSNTGMETTLSFLLNSALACFTVIWSRKRSHLALTFCIFFGYLSYLARPDNGIYALILPPLYLLATDHKLWKQSLLYTALLILILLLDLWLKKFWFGSIAPYPFFAKSNGFYLGYLGANTWNAMTMMIIFWGAALPFVLIIVNMLTWRSLAKLAAIAIPITATFMYYATVIQIMGWPARYYYPSLPFFILGAFAVLDFCDAETIWVNSIRKTLGIRILFSLVALFPVISVPFQKTAIHYWEINVIGKPIVITPKNVYTTRAEFKLPELGTWGSIMQMRNFLKQLPTGTVIAATEYGFIGSELPNLTILDLLGLHDYRIAHNGFTAKYVFSREPDIIWFPHPDYSFTIAEIMDSRSFVSDYDYYPGAYDYGIAIRKTSAKYELINRYMEKEFSRIYPGLKMSDYKAELVDAP